MSTNYPTTKQTIPNPTSTDLLENATAELDHDYQHATANDTIGALQDKVGMDGSAVTTSHDYKLSGVTGGDKAVSKTGTETLTNKTLTSPQINFGSDAIGDLAYRNGSSTTARLPIGTEAQIMAVSSGVPAWVANPSASTASTTTAGIVELATTAETTTGTDTARAVTPDGLHDMTSLEGAAWFLDEDDLATDSATKVPSQQSVKAYADALRTFTSGTASKNASDASTTQNIAHGLGKIPKKVRLTARSTRLYVDGFNTYISDTIYNGTTQSSTSITGAQSSPYFANGTTFSINSSSSDGTQAGVVTFDATNIIITWTKTSSPTGTYYIIWEAES